MKLTPRQRFLRYGTTLARRDNAQVLRFRHRSPDRRALRGFFLEHHYQGWSRMLQRLTDPNRQWVEAQTQGMRVGKFTGHGEPGHSCYLDR